jgi:hypothetical protein
VNVHEAGADDAGLSNLTVRLNGTSGETTEALSRSRAMPVRAADPGRRRVRGRAVARPGPAVEGPRGVGLGYHGARSDWLPDADGDGPSAEWRFTGPPLARDLTEKHTGVLRRGYLRTPPPVRGIWTSLFNAGLTFAVTPDFQLDTGARLGISDTADDSAFFLGISYRR